MAFPKLTEFRQLLYKQKQAADACPTLNIHGQVQINGQPPVIAFVPEAVYIPASKGHPGGLFDNSLKPIHQAISYRDSQIWLSPPITQNIDINKLPLIEGDGPYFFIGDIKRHYGHFLLESTARLWPLCHLQTAFSGKYLYCSIDPASTLFAKKFITDIFGAFSLKNDGFVSYSQPCRLKNVFVPAPAFEIRLQSSPIFRQTTLHIGNHLAKNLAEIHNTNLTPLYLSKSALRGGVSNIINETEIEESLRKKGVDIWHPEKADLATQINVLSARKYILGFVGSALHTLLFCPGEKIISGVTLTNQLYSSYIIIDKLCDNTSQYESGPTIGISLFHDPKPNKNPCFVHSFHASNPDSVAETLLRNAKL